MNKETKKVNLIIDGKSRQQRFDEFIKNIEDTQKENTNLKQALIDIREYCNFNNDDLYTCESDYNYEEELELNYYSSSFREDILQIIDRVLGDEK